MSVCFRPPANRSSQAGVSLVELMIGITVGLIILAGVVTVVSKTTFSGLENVRAIQLDQQVRGTMDLIHRELQRAGYVNSWDPTAGGVADPKIDDYIDVDAISLFGDITLGGNCVAGVCDCVLYSYDLDADGLQGAGGADPFELFAFRHNPNRWGAGLGAIEMRVSGTHDCNDGGWNAITDSSVNVTALTFENGIIEDATPTAPLSYDGTDDGVHVYTALDGDDDSCTANADPTIGDVCVCAAGDTCLEKRKLSVVIDAELVSDPGINVRIRNQVAVKNHHYYDIPGP